ncbi:MAG: radical SAM protein [Pseudomonadota bacterium]
MTNILLVTPLNVPFNETMAWMNQNPLNLDKNYIKRKIDPKYPVGNLCIGAYLKNNISDVKIKILDYNTVALRYLSNNKDELTRESFFDFGLDILKTKNMDFEYIPDIIGISALFSSNYFDMGALIEFFSRKFPKSLIVSGGHLSSACYSDFLKNYPDLMAVGYGECEIPFTKLVEAIKRGEAVNYLENDSSWITKKKLLDENFKPTNTLIKDLDEIPPYELEMLLHPDDYFNSNDDVFTLGTDNKSADEKDIAMFATRGCPYHCIFCASQFVHGHKVRKYSIERLKKDILHYNYKYGITSFPFIDDHFLANKQNAIEILDFIHENGFSSRIFNLAYIHVDRDIVKALKKTGSDRALITIDGMNEDFLRKTVRKPANFAKAKDVIKIFREEGLIVINNNIIGFPGETPEDIDRGVNTMLDMGANWYAILTAIPLQGSELYRICEEKGYLPKNESIYTTDFHKSVIQTSEFTPEWIQKKAYEINLHLNFVNNYDMRHNEYEIPLSLYERLLEKVIDTHAFAYYFGAICAKKLNYSDKYEKYKEKYYEMNGKYIFWKEWSNHFNLSDL